jgi:hypothetical protein
MRAPQRRTSNWPAYGTTLALTSRRYLRICSTGTRPLSGERGSEAVSLTLIGARPGNGASLIPWRSTRVATRPVAGVICCGGGQGIGTRLIPCLL